MKLETFKTLEALFCCIKKAESALKTLHGNELNPESGLNLEVDTCNYDMGRKIHRSVNLDGKLGRLVYLAAVEVIEKYHAEILAEFDQIEVLTDY